MEALTSSDIELLDRPLPGAAVLAFTPRVDSRGWFTRTFCATQLERLGLPLQVAQANVSRSDRRGTLRGLHYQLPPSAEAKLVRCIAGAVHDVVLDLRAGSPTFGRHFAVELDENNGRAVFVPPGCAHGFLTLTDGALVLYFVSARYDPARERGVRFDDPAFAIRWPFPPAVVSDRDLSHPDFDPRRGVDI